MATGLKNLKVYKLAFDLELQVFDLIKKFPIEEKYRSIDQLSRSSSSVTNNIAESYQKRSFKEKVRIVNDIAIAEAEETRSGLEVTLEKGFHTNKKLIGNYTELIKMLVGYMLNSSGNKAVLKLKTYNC